MESLGACLCSVKCGKDVITLELLTLCEIDQTNPFLQLEMQFEDLKVSFIINLVPQPWKAPPTFLSYIDSVLGDCSPHYVIAYHN